MIAIIMIATYNLSAQTIVMGDDTDNRAYLRMGIDPATMVTLGYQRNFRNVIWNRSILAYGEWGTVLTKPGTKHSELKVGGLMPIYERGQFKVVNNLNLSAGTVETINFTSHKFAAGDEVAIGFYWHKAFVAVTAEYEKTYLNKLEHTEHYRTTYYEDAVDGWYKGGGGMFQFGLEGGYTFKGRYDLHLELKMPFTEKFNSYGGAPMHVNIGFGYRF